MYDYIVYTKCVFDNISSNIQTYIEYFFSKFVVWKMCTYCVSVPTVQYHLKFDLLYEITSQRKQPICGF